LGLGIINAGLVIGRGPNACQYSEIISSLTLVAAGFNLKSDIMIRYNGENMFNELGKI